MSSSLSDHGHALRPDGSLKDASEILWSYDEDESLPFPLDGAPTPSSSGSHAPATTVAGIRRTTRVIRPSQRALDAAETSSSIPASAGVKRKARGPELMIPSLILVPLARLLGALMTAMAVKMPPPQR